MTAPVFPMEKLSGFSMLNPIFPPYNEIKKKQRTCEEILFDSSYYEESKSFIVQICQRVPGISHCKKWCLLFSYLLHRRHMRSQGSGDRGQQIRWMPVVTYRSNNERFMTLFLRNLKCHTCQNVFEHFKDPPMHPVYKPL